MRMHSMLPWPPVVLPPERKTEPSRKTKTTDTSLNLSESAVYRVPPPPKDPNSDDPPGDNVNITV
jgi:hypothetical protein